MGSGVQIGALGTVCGHRVLWDPWGSVFVDGTFSHKTSGSPLRLWDPLAWGCDVPSAGSICAGLMLGSRTIKAL